MTTVLLWFVRKVQIFHRHLWIYLTVTQSTFDELVQNLDKNVIWNNLCTFPFKTQNWYFPPNNFILLFLKRRFFDFVYDFSDHVTFFSPLTTVGFISFPNGHSTHHDLSGVMGTLNVRYFTPCFSPLCNCTTQTFQW